MVLSPAACPMGAGQGPRGVWGCQVPRGSCDPITALTRPRFPYKITPISRPRGVSRAVSQGQALTHWDTDPSPTPACPPPAAGPRPLSLPVLLRGLARGRPPEPRALQQRESHQWGTPSRGTCPPPTPSRDSRNGVSHQDNTKPPGSTVPSRHRISTRVHPPPCGPPPSPSRLGITRLLLVLKATLTSAPRSPHALTSVCAAPHPTPRSGGAPGYRGALLWSQSRVFFMQNSPPSPAQTMSLLWRARRRGRVEGPAGHCRTLAAGQEVTGLSPNAPPWPLGSGSPGTVRLASP